MEQLGVCGGEENEEKVNFPIHRCCNMVLNITERLISLIVFSVFKYNHLVLWNRSFLHLFPTMELPLIGLPRTGSHYL